MIRLFLILRLLLSRDALHTYIAALSLYGVWCGLAEIHRPSAMVAVSSLLLSGVVYARTRPAVSPDVATSERKAAS